MVNVISCSVGNIATYQVSQKLYLILMLNFGAVHFSMTKMLVPPDPGDMYKSFGTQSVCFNINMPELINDNKIFCKVNMSGKLYSMQFHGLKPNQIF